MKVRVTLEIEVEPQASVRSAEVAAEAIVRHCLDAQRAELTRLAGTLRALPLTMSAVRSANVPAFEMAEKLSDAALTVRAEQIEAAAKLKLGGGA